MNAAPMLTIQKILRDRRDDQMHPSATPARHRRLFALAPGSAGIWLVAVVVGPVGAVAAEAGIDMVGGKRRRGDRRGDTALDIADGCRWLRALVGAGIEIG